MRARAWLLGYRIDVRPLEARGPVALAPLTLRAGRSGTVVLFRFGAACGFGLDEAEEAELLASLMPFVVQPFPTAERESEECEVVLDPSAQEGLDARGRLVLQDDSAPRLQVVAHVLAKSAVLSRHEGRVGQTFDRLEALAGGLGARAGRRASAELRAQIASALQVQSETVGRVEVAEKPEITWDRPDLDRLYERLARDYELAERDRALSRKLDLVATTAITHLDLALAHQNVRLEWYIVILILVEIVLILYGFARG